MALFTTLTDNFDDGTLAAVWTTNSYGGVTEPGGRVRIPCIVGDYAGLQSGKTYNINNSSVFAELVTLPAVGAATAVNLGFFVTQVTEGTSIGFEINIATNSLRCVSNTAYWDAGATVLTFDHAVHRWFRLRADDTNVYWDTSADGSTWTNRRTLAKPAWVTSTADAQAFDTFANKVGGTTDYVEWDNVNVAAGTAHTADTSDSEGITDNLSLVQALTHNPSETVGLTDSASLVQTQSDSLAETLGLTDSLFLELGVPYSTSDSVGITDSLSLGISIPLTFSDSIGVTDDSASIDGQEGPPGPVDVGPDGSLVLGPATLYLAPYGALEPANSSVSVEPDLGVWTDLGGVFGGVELSVEQEWEEIRPRQIGFTVTRRMKRRKLTIKTNLAEPTLENLAYALNDTPALSAGTGWSSYTPTDQHEGLELDYFALIIDGWAPGFNAATRRHKRRRLIVRKVLSVDSVQFAYKKDGQTVFTVTWACHYVDASTPPFRIIDEA